MAKKEQLKQQKEEKEKRKNKKGDKSFTSLWLFLVVAVAAIVIGITQVKRRPVEPMKVSFPLPPDARPPTCPKGAKVKDGKETVSIIIPYLNEEWFRIEATMQSLVKYTDMSLVYEIMWVSDGNSPDKVFASELKAMHPKVSVYENEKNLGLITTKMNAAKWAKGSVLMFLEPHVIVNTGWLQPLLTRLAEEPKALIMPALDALGEDLSYHVAGAGHWRFEWNLNLVYTNPGEVTNRDQPYLSPATSGGIYAIRRDWWDMLELFDPELVRWGGDHVEASHKVWRCGGRIEVHPCSRVGHWFREVAQRPYDVKVESVVRNYKRLAEVWFDEYKDHFYKVKPEARPMETGDISEMKARRERLQCKDMSWYIKHVDVELGWEADRICIPNAEKEHGGCGKGTQAAHLHSTVEHSTPLSEFKRLSAAAEAYQKQPEGPCCKAKGRGCKRICRPGESPSF
jgi:polypeptide N-acetylgalactosaminyltransferase